jgi:hypothetical protein
MTMSASAPATHFAALNVATGAVIPDVRKSHPSPDLVAFLNKVNRQVPSSWKCTSSRIACKPTTPGAGSWPRVAQTVNEVLGPGGVGDPADDVALVHVEAGSVGLSHLLACIPDFSSTYHTTAFCGGLRFRPHTSSAARGLGLGWAARRQSSPSISMALVRRIRSSSSGETRWAKRSTTAMLLGQVLSWWG